MDTRVNWDAQEPKVACGECNRLCNEDDMEYDKWDYTLLCSDCKHAEGKTITMVKKGMKMFGMPVK